jgi:hypothetical protein
VRQLGNGGRLPYPINTNHQVDRGPIPGIFGQDTVLAIPEDTGDLIAKGFTKPGSALDFAPALEPLHVVDQPKGRGDPKVRLEQALFKFLEGDFIKATPQDTDIREREVDHAFPKRLLLFFRLPKQSHHRSSTRKENGGRRPRPPSTLSRVFMPQGSVRITPIITHDLAFRHPKNRCPLKALQELDPKLGLLRPADPCVGGNRISGRNVHIQGVHGTPVPVQLVVEVRPPSRAQSFRRNQ